MLTETCQVVTVVAAYGLAIAGLVVLFVAGIRCLRKKRPSAKRTFLVSMALLGGAFLAFQVGEIIRIRTLLGDVVGVSFWPREEFAYDSDREFLLGDGVSVRVFTIPEELLARLTNGVALAADGLPRMSVAPGSGWKQVRWKKGPLIDEESGLDLWFLNAWSNSEPKQKRFADWMSNTLKREDCLYGYWFKTIGVNITDVWFCLIDPRTGRLLIIDINT